MELIKKRLRDYHLLMSIYKEQHKIVLPSDVIDMIEQLQNDLKEHLSNSDNNCLSSK